MCEKGGETDSELARDDWSGFRRSGIRHGTTTFKFFDIIAPKCLRASYRTPATPHELASSASTHTFNS